MTPYQSLSILTMIAIIGVLPVGCNRQQKRVSQVNDPLACGKPTRLIGKNIYYRTCECKGKNHPDGKKCLKMDKEPDNEDKWRLGSCSRGVCELKNLTKSCQNVPQLPPGSAPPLGCAFFCNSAEGQYGFFPPGTPCQHKISPRSYINRTCRASGENVVCSDVMLPPAC